MLILLFSVYHGHIQSSQPENLQKIYYTQTNSFQRDLANRTIYVGPENPMTGNDRFSFVSYSYDYWNTNKESLGWSLNLETLANAIEYDLGLEKISDSNTRKEIADLIREKIEIDRIIKENALPKTVYDFPYELLTFFQKSFWTINIKNVKAEFKTRLNKKYDMVKIKEDFNSSLQSTAHNAAYHKKMSATFCVIMLLISFGYLKSIRWTLCAQLPTALFLAFNYLQLKDEQMKSARLKKGLEAFESWKIKKTETIE